MNRRRPLVLWLILVFYVATAASRIIRLALLHSGVIPLGAEDWAILEGASFGDYALSFTTSVGVALGAVLLFALKRTALPVLCITLALGIGMGLWRGISPWQWSIPLVFTIAYAERLRRRGALR